MPNPSPSGKRFKHLLLRWFLKNGRNLPWRQTNDPYAIWVSEVMLQQTQVKTVIPYYQRFLSRFPTIQRLALAREQTVLKHWEGLGYYRRARFLHDGAKKILKDWNGEFPKDPVKIRSIPGIGPYMLGAIASIAYELPLPLIDGNVKRVFSRIYYGRWKTAPSDKEFWALARELMPFKDCGDYNQALMELGATVCTPDKPLCARCPIRNYCGALVQQKIATATYHGKRAAQPKKYFVGLLIEKNGKLLLQQRAGTLLGGLWQIPQVQLPAPEKIPADIKKHSISLGVAKHTYTHFKQHLEVRRWTAKMHLKKISGVWKTPAELKRLPMSKINLNIVKKYVT